LKPHRRDGTIISDELAKTFGVMLAAIERCDELGLAEHEPCTTLTLTGGAPDAEL
jgi:hypothetical protein